MASAIASSSPRSSSAFNVTLDDAARYFAVWSLGFGSAPYSRSTCRPAVRHTLAGMAKWARGIRRWVLALASGVVASMLATFFTDGRGVPFSVFIAAACVVVAVCTLIERQAPTHGGEDRQGNRFKNVNYGRQKIGQQVNIRKPGARRDG